jgi:hypothetical protein
LLLAACSLIISWLTTRAIAVNKRGAITNIERLPFLFYRGFLPFSFYCGLIVSVISSCIWVMSFGHARTVPQIISSGMMFFGTVLCLLSLLSGEAFANAEEADSDGN